MAAGNKKLSNSDYVHLHMHTMHSLLDGLTKIPALVEQVKDFGMEACAITDHGSMSGAVEFYNEANKHKVKPIIGIEAYMAPRQLSDKEAGKDKQYFHLTLLAMSDKGYQNLMRLATIAHLEGFYYKPRIDREVLEKYNEGLIVLSGCINSEFCDALRHNQSKKAEETAKWYQKVFGDRYYIEVQDHGHPDHPTHWSEQKRVNEQAIKIAKKLNIQPVVTGDAHYLHKEDQDAHEVLLCVQTGSFLSDENRMSLKDLELYVADPGDIIKRWDGQLPEGISNTKAIAERCDVKIELGEYLIPNFPLPKGESEATHLEKLTEEGLKARYGKKLTKEAKDRAKYELGVINKMGFAGYFLIVQDFINWGKERGIVFGPGRGSGAGSIVAYALRITELDPLKYDLLFERFLNPDRISMPDFDIDIQDNRRDEVINYCIKKYGRDRVANIVTFGTMAARNAVRDVARVLQVPYAEADRLAKMIPPPVQGRHIPLEESLKSQADLKKEYKENDTSKEIFDLAIKLEGTIRSHGVHAAGVVIAPDNIVKFTPLEMAQKGVVATQYSMGPIEEIGLLKMDFLGLSNLTIIKNTLRIVRKVHRQKIDIEEIPLDNAKTFELFQRGDTTGVFQLESSGMKRYLKDLKPTRFDDIIAMVALYRPGPLTAGLTDSFVRRKNGQEDVSYDHPSMKDALQTTYGVLVYQEQVMQIVRDMCGFSGPQSDTLRKAVGKKQRSMMAKLKDQVISGAVQNKVPKKVAEKFWNDLVGFADYAFNKSHAACYAMIAYQTAYLKAHWPAEFMAALMTSDFGNTDRLAIEIAECKHMGIEVLPPDVNESFSEFGIVPGKQAIRYCMSAIKNVGESAAKEIVRAREEGGKFASLEDFLSRVDSRMVNKRALESLAKTGAFDSFASRSQIVGNLDLLVAYGGKMTKERSSGQTDLFGGNLADAAINPKLDLTGAEEIDQKTQLSWERELAGLYLSQHPLHGYEDRLSGLSQISALKSKAEGVPTRIGGIVMDVREVVTRNGQKMAFVRVEDLAGGLEVVVFPRVYAGTNDLWQKDQILQVKGRLSRQDRMGNSQETKIIVEEASFLTDTPPSAGTPQPAADDNGSKKIYVRLPNSDDEKNLKSLKSMLDKNPGTTAVVLVIGDGDDRQAVKLPTHTQPSDELLSWLKRIFGSNSVKYQ